jgi:hypothetical protein
MSTQFQEFVTGIQRLPIRVGSVSPPQQDFIRSFMNEHPEIHTILETGFHVGLSAATFLDTRPDVNVISFDIFWFDYTRRAKLLLDIAYPGRNLLIAGNSITSLPTWFALSAAPKPDLVFIDGGHERPVPAIDLYHILRELPVGTWVMVDDYCEEHGSQGVMEAVNVCAYRGEIVDITAYKAADRGWVMGRRSGTPLTPLPELASLDALVRDTESHYP